MSKNEMTLEQALEAAALCKDAVRAAKAELKAFRKEKGLKPDEVPGGEKDVKTLNKLTKKLETAEEDLEKANEAAKALKPVKTRETSYQYPENCTTAADKKKYRAKMRREKKSAAKAAEKAEAKAEEAPKAEEGATKKKKVKKEESED